MTQTAYIALGANLGATIEANRATLNAAIAAIDQLDSTQVSARSSFYRTAPIGYTDQPDFVNAVVAVWTALTPIALLNALHAIEDRFGRERTFRNAPRTLDLDLLVHGAQRITTAQLTVPHPRLHERAFVLAPLAEIAPALEIPERGRVHELLARLIDGGSDQDIEKLPPSSPSVS